MITKYIIFRKEVIELTQGEDLLWRDSDGGIWADSDNGKSKDSYDGCGVTPFDLPPWGIFQKLNDICKLHNYKYNSLTWQTFHTRKEADDALRSDIENSGSIFWILGRLFRNVAREFGGSMWENKKTNN